jgi:hypothetical protein
MDLGSFECRESLNDVGFEVFAAGAMVVTAL